MLEDALVAAGAMRPSNAGAPHKVAWSRSSRTDAGVHSLATVAGMRLEMEPGYAASAGTTDPEGRLLAASINAHLPPSIRIFSAQRVPGGWDARNMCGQRDYRYYLPASLLGAEPGTTAGDVALAAFRATLACYEGTHAFHNYTVRRSYRAEAKESAANRRAGPGRRRERKVVDDDDEVGGGAGEEVEGEEEEGDGALAAAALPAPTSPPVPRGDRTCPLLIAPTWWPLPGPPGDPIGPAHYRRVDTARASDPAPLVPGGHPAIELRLEGGSFMLRQLRHMVGGAVGVARGALPPGYPAAALRPGARATLPLAPAETLLLSHATFGLYPAGATGIAGAPPPWVGDRLRLDGPAGHAAVAEFRGATLAPALSGLCDPSLPAWEWWGRTLGRYAWDAGEMDRFLEAAAADKDDASARAAARAADLEAAGGGGEVRRQRRGGGGRGGRAG